MGLVVHPPGRGFSISRYVHNSAGTVGSCSLMCLVVHPRVVDSLSPDMSTIALGPLGINSLRGAGSYVVALVFGGSILLLWQTERGKFSTDGNPVDTTGGSYFMGTRPTFRFLQQSPPSQYGLRRVTPRHRGLNGICRFCPRPAKVP